MFELEWRGGAPKPALAASLKGLGVAIVPAAAVRVVQTRTAAVPAAPTGSASWLWVSEAKLSSQVALEAIGRGAYDSVSLGEKDGEARLLVRLRELFSPDPQLKPPPGFIADSESARALLKRLYQAARTSMPVLL